MAKVSIIVPVYKVEKYIGQCVESIQKQSFSDIEVILVDDGSPDKSGNICDEYAKNDTRIKVIHKKNGGVSAARNDGLKIATGEYVIFADSDDYLPKTAIEELYNTVVKYKADVVIGDIILVYEDKEKYAHFFEKPFYTRKKTDIDNLIKTNFYANYCPNPYLGKPAFGYGSPCNKLVKRSLVTRAKISFDLRVKGIFDDIIYCAYVLANAESVAYTDKAVYYYRMLDTSITQTYKANMLQINEAIFIAWEEFLAKYDRSNTFRSAYYANVLRRFDEALSKYFFNKKNEKSDLALKKELRDTINSSPYCEIVENVDVDILSKKHKLLMKQLRKKSILGLRLVHSAIKLKNKIHS